VNNIELEGMALQLASSLNGLVTCDAPEGLPKLRTPVRFSSPALSPSRRSSPTLSRTVIAADARQNLDVQQRATRTLAFSATKAEVERALDGRVRALSDDRSAKRDSTGPG
jgi:hypothetical protein